jgi:hypothetical protein
MANASNQLSKVYFNRKLVKKYIKGHFHPFWGEVFNTIEPILEGSIFCSPEKVLLASFWDNPLVKRGSKPIKKGDFPEIAHVVSKLSDFSHPNTNNMYTHQEFMAKYEIDLQGEKFIDLRYIISCVFMITGIDKNDLYTQCEPSQPLIFNIAMTQITGCSS